MSLILHVEYKRYEAHVMRRLYELSLDSHQLIRTLIYETASFETGALA